MVGEIIYRPWQKYVIGEVMHSTKKGCFIEAAGGRGKTVCALEIARQKRAKKVIVINNSLSILKGWRDTQKKLFSYDMDIVTTTQRSLSKHLSDTYDVMIVDEWQNASSDRYTKLYKKVKRNYTIGLSATPVRQKGLNFYNLEKTIWGVANPNRKYDWQLTWGKMVYDRFTYSKSRWEDFKDYEAYKNQLPLFFGFDEIEEIEQAKENNGHALNFESVMYKPAMADELKVMLEYNVFKGTNGTYGMPKGSFGRKAVLSRAVKGQTEIIDGKPRVKLSRKDRSDFLVKLNQAIMSHQKPVLITTKQKDLAEELYNLKTTGIGLWTGDSEIKLDSSIVVATQQKIGVGVDGLQNKFRTMIVFDPVDEDSGEYDDYRQLIWRIAGSRQQHDVTIVEMRCEDENLL